MNVSECVHCDRFPCPDVDHAGYILPEIDIDPASVSIVLISEAAPANPADYYYAPGDPMFKGTTVQSFRAAGLDVDSIEDIVSMGVYLTTAVKCAKIGYGVQTGTVDECSRLLEQELALFPNVKAYLLMGDVAIRAVCAIAKRNKQPRPIPSGSTYKIRGGEFYFHGVRAFPSYLQVGGNILIEKGKMGIIAQDISRALAVAGLKA